MLPQFGLKKKRHEEAKGYDMFSTTPEHVSHRTFPRQKQSNLTCFCNQPQSETHNE